MKRRTLLKRVGAATTASIAVSGIGSAEKLHGPLAIDGEIDVSNVSGRVPLTEVLDDAHLAQIGNGVDPSKVIAWVDPSVDTLDDDQSCCQAVCGDYSCCTFCHPCIELELPEC